MFVEDGEHESLHAVGKQPRLEAAAKEPDEAVLLDHVADDLRVGDDVRERLARCLDYSETDNLVINYTFKWMEWVT